MNTETLIVWPINDEHTRWVGARQHPVYTNQLMPVDNIATSPEALYDNARGFDRQILTLGNVPTADSDDPLVRLCAETTPTIRSTVATRREDYKFEVKHYAHKIAGYEEEKARIEKQQSAMPKEYRSRYSRDLEALDARIADAEKIKQRYEELHALAFTS